MKLTVLAVAAASIVVCAGCGASPAKPIPGPGLAAVKVSPSAGVSPTASVSPVATQSAGHNRAATEAETKRLLALAPLPSGAKPVNGPERKLDGPAMGTPSTSSLIDRHGFWQTSMPVAAVWSYINSRMPNGLTPGGQGTSTTRGVLTSEGVGWDESDTSYATGLQLEISVAPNADGTLIRADGVGEWLDPRPMRDSTAGPRLRVTVAGGCPRGDNSAVGVSNPGPGLDDALLPAGAPAAGLICQYGGLNSTPVSGLTHHIQVNAADAARIATQARRLPIDHQDDVETSCPAGDDSFDVIALQFAGQPDVDLGFAASGCQTVANGHIVVNGGLNLNRWITPLRP
jgi:hypothetical protein